MLVGGRGCAGGRVRVCWWEGEGVLVVVIRRCGKERVYGVPLTSIGSVSVTTSLLSRC